MNTSTQAATNLPQGYRQAFVTANVAILGFSLAYLRFVVFDPDSGPWTQLGVVVAVVGSIGTLVLLFTLWRSLRLVDDLPRIYSRTLRWFAAGMILMTLSLALYMASYFVYSDVSEADQPTTAPQPRHNP